MLEEFLNKTLCGDEEKIKYVYENVPNMKSKIEKIVALKIEFDERIGFLEMDVYNALMEMEE